MPDITKAAGSGGLCDDYQLGLRPATVGNIHAGHARMTIPPDTLAFPLSGCPAHALSPAWGGLSIRVFLTLSTSGERLGRE